MTKRSRTKKDRTVPDKEIRCEFGKIFGPNGKEPGYDGPDHCAECATAQAEADATADESSYPAQSDSAPAVEAPAEQPVHMARCEACKGTVEFRRTRSGNGFMLLGRRGYDEEATFGIGPSGLPVCPVNGHGEMQLADEQLVPASEAISQVAEKVTTGAPPPPQQGKMPFPVTEPNWKAMQEQTAELRSQVRQKAARAKDMHDRYGQLKKAADEAQSRLSEWEDKCADRIVEWENYLERLADAREAAECEAETGGAPADVLNTQTESAPWTDQAVQ